MPKKRTPRQRKAAQERARAQQRLAAAERFREEHARIVAERAGDPRFVHRVTDPNGATTVRWEAGTPADGEIHAAMAIQRDLFMQKFGREPGPADPVFFDPDADEPRPLRPESFDAELADLADRAAETGVDPAFIQAWRELGYLVTDENRHMFSAEETAAWRDAVLRHRGEQDFDDDA